MASSSSSKYKPQWIYDVFINFRGEDTRKNFVSHLYSHLSNAGVNTFLDEENLRRGRELGPELLRAIEGSPISVVVFSEKYVDSSWCREELVKIMECHAITGQVVLPVFYNVTPSYLRSFDETFTEAKDALLADKLKRNRALIKAADLAGWDVRNHSNESTVVKEIVDTVLNILDKTYMSITDFPVGLEPRVQHVIQFIEKRSTGVCIIGIWGMGGVGKTTIAKVIYNELRHEFKAKSFLANIREVWENDRGQIDLQEQLLLDIIKTGKMKVHSIEWGQAMIKETLCTKRALVVLDDVCKFEQLNALCGNRDEIGPGSVIIITTRDVRLLNVLAVDYIYGVEEMTQSESLELFSWHAFRQANPTKDFFRLSRDVVAYCGGLPLALEVLGSYLYKRRKEEWENVLSKLKIIPNDQIQKKLKISFDGLSDYMEKDIFLDICCFFIGKDRAYVTEILNGCGLHAEIGITVLVERSLIKVEKNNKLSVHDLLRDMGREIVRQSSPEEPEKRSRLWVHEEIIDVLTEHTGTKAIQGLAMKLQRINGVCFSTKAFEKMKRLRLLQVDHVQLAGDYEYLPKHLRWVQWHGFPLKHIPGNFYQGKVVAIDLKHSNLKLVWKEAQLLDRLKILNLSHSRYLTETPDFSKLPNLEKLILKDCPKLSKVHQSIGDLSNLLLINLKDCTSLSNLPMVIYKLKSVKTLILSGCSKIVKLEEDIVQMESLTTLIADNTGVKQVPFSIVRSKSIGYISLCGYEGLARNVFPSLIWSWMSPATNLVSCVQPFGRMSTSLVSMDIPNNNLCDLLPMLSGLSTLRSIWVQCDSEFQLSQELKRILDDLCNVKFPELERTLYASQISENSMGSRLIGMGSCHQVINMLSNSISEGLITNGSSDFLLPGDNYPHWLAYKGKGHSVLFQVPEDGDCRMKGMALCVVYSSTPENMGTESLVSVLIINYTKCTIVIYKRDTAMSFNDEDWQGLISNLGPGNNVEIFVAFGHGLIVKETAVYLIYGQSIIVEIEPSPEMEPITVEFEPSINVENEPSINVQIDPSPELNIQPSPNMKMEPSPKPNKSFFTVLTKRMGECLCLNRN